MDERFAEKLPHAAVDFSRTKVAVIEKNLELRAGFLVVIWQRHGNGRRNRGFRFWRRFRPTGRRHLWGRLGRDGGQRDQNNENSGMHRRSNRLEWERKQTHLNDSRRPGTSPCPVRHSGRRAAWESAAF